MSEKIKEILCEYEGCRLLFTPKKKGQRFHCLRCRQLWHRTHGRANGIQGTISSLRLLKGGKTSMVIRFGEAERGQVTAFSQGQKIKVVDT